MTRIEALLNKYKSDKCTAHSYGDFYDKLLTPLCDKEICLLEVGILEGASLRAWSEFLPLATIIGLDNYANPILLPNRCTLARADSTNLEQVNTALGELTFDIVIDDALHWIDNQKKTFENLWMRVKPNGYYIIEDIQCIDEAKPVFDPLGFEFIDLRSKKNRGDDVLAVIRKPAQ
jgi:hypothetical protein